MTPKVAARSAHADGAAGRDSSTAVLTAPPSADRRGRIEPAVPPKDPPPSRISRYMEPASTIAKTPEAPPEVSHHGNGHVNGHAYLHPLAEAVARPLNEPLAATPASAEEFSEKSQEVNGAPGRGHGVLAADELTPGERWKRAWEEPKPTLLQKLRQKLSADSESVSAFARPSRTLDDGFSLPTKLALLIGGVGGLVGMIYLVFYFLLWSRISFNP